MEKLGELKSLLVPSWAHEIPEDYGITSDEAKTIAKNLFKKYLPDIEGEYELLELKKNMETEENSYIWYATFYKKYGDLINPYERVSVNFIPTINEIYQLVIERDKFENNEIKIPEEQATEIAKNKDNEIEQNRKIINISCEIGIGQMNADAYLRETKKDEYEKREIPKEEYYVTDKRVRRVWFVSIEYEKQEDKISRFTYYVDATTGEIIGGGLYKPSIIENLKEDENNFA